MNVDGDIKKLRGLTEPDGDYSYVCGLHLIIDLEHAGVAEAIVYVKGARSNELTDWFKQQLLGAA